MVSSKIICGCKMRMEQHAVGGASPASEAPPVGAPAGEHFRGEALEERHVRRPVGHLEEGRAKRFENAPGEPRHLGNEGRVVAGPAFDAGQQVLDAMPTYAMHGPGDDVPEAATHLVGGHGVVRGAGGPCLPRRPP